MKASQTNNAVGWNISDQSVARDLLAALSEECFCDLQLIGRDDVSIPAIRFVLAARSNVLRKMLFGDFCESKQPSIRLSYSQDTLSAIVHFCSFNVIPPRLFLAGSSSHPQQQHHHPPNEGELIDNIQLFVELFQAADFLELPLLGELAQDYVTNQMTKYPSLACIVLEAASTTDSSLAQLASQIIECRPYVALNPNIAYLSSEKVKRVLQNNAIGAGEWFLLQMLQLWHKEQPDTGRLLNNTTRDICQSCIKLSYIEPALLLSLQDSSAWIPKDFIFDAIAKQALKASQFKVWRLECRGRNVNDDRVLVEGAGSPEVNGMYYRLSSSLSLLGKNSNDLYVKRELAGGQSFVYTLSRRLQSATAEWQTTTKKYECRIFRNKFLTHQAVRKLHTMQLEGTVQNSFQPILQILQVDAPDESDTAVPTPIRKFHRVRLSDGDHSMPGTLSDTNINLEKLTGNQVIQVQEFGLYTIYDCVGVHVIRAKVRASGPLFRFGNPQPMPPILDNMEGRNHLSNVPSDNNNNNHNNDDHPGQSSDHATFYTVVYQDTTLFTRIPKVGWCSEESGVDPPPECTYIAVRDETDVGSSDFLT